ncbi:MAG TPA: YceD family protein [Verrucomicrobiota bacterium]|nr:YceD family protein [Verrucomicrobiota bacterium]HNU50104.1 YceD family protein [Verrucomicrobiota bacterium]
MSLSVNLRHLERHAVTLAGSISPAELDLVIADELIRAPHPLRYCLTVERVAEGLLVTGQLELLLACVCARCLKPFAHTVRLDPWTCHLPLEGEEAVPLHGDLVDLTAPVREDILLSFPQHPLCEPECRGLPSAARNTAPTPDPGAQSTGGASAWAALDKLNL